MSKKYRNMILKMLFVDVCEIFMDADIAYKLLRAQVSGTEMFWRMVIAIISMRLMKACIYHIIRTTTFPKEKIED